MMLYEPIQQIIVPYMMMIITYNPHRDTEEPKADDTENPGRRTSWVNVVWKVWMSVSVSEDPPTPGDTL